MSPNSVAMVPNVQAPSSSTSPPPAPPPPPYTPDFYAWQMQRSLESARVILPIVLAHVTPRSVVDVGCGVGPWLKACTELGIDDHLGLDGDYIDPSQLMISPRNFTARDLGRPIGLSRRFDLCMSLEVGEHLPAERAASYVEDLTRLADVVLFSAAIPYQGGTAHINEQWPEYWAILFARCEFTPVDVVRPAVEADPRVCAWYRQNTLVFAAPGMLDRFPASARAAGRALTRIDPEIYSWAHVRGRVQGQGRHRDADAAYQLALRSAWIAGRTDLPAPPREYGPELAASSAAPASAGGNPPRP